jgi:hypothetical protein
MSSIKSRTLVSLFLAGLTVQTATAAPKGNTGANTKTENDGWTYVEVGAKNTEVSPYVFHLLLTQSRKGCSPRSLDQHCRRLQDWRIWLEKDGCPASFWHDVPLYPDESNKQIINFVVEIPRWTNGKIETSRDEPFSEHTSIYIFYLGKPWLKPPRRPRPHLP